MWVVFLLLLLPLPLSLHAEDLGKLSANTDGLSGLSGLFGSSGGGPDPTNKINETDQFVSPYGAGNPYSPSSPTNPYGAACELKGDRFGCPLISPRAV